jgi:MFS family permease
MRPTIELLRLEPRARVFFAVLAQSALGTGAGYIALLLLAYERLPSAWAISLVLVADLIAPMLLGPVFGAAADRWSRRSCLVVADVIRGAAFLGLALVPSYPATVALAVVAGVGTGLFTPAGLAALPGLVVDRRLPAATSLYGAIADLGFTAGPALAAVVLIFASPESLMLANALTFAISAAVLARVPFASEPAAGVADGIDRKSLLREAREGIVATRGMQEIRVVIVASSAVLFCGGLFNVAELLFAREELGASAAGFSVLVALFGLGFVAGSLAGASGGDPTYVRRRFGAGLIVMGFGLLASGLAPTYVVALATFGLAGFGNGMVLVYERLLIQTGVRDAMLARVFGIKDALASWAFVLAFASAGALISLFGTRAVIASAGLAGMAVGVLATAALQPRGRRAAARTPIRGELVERP